MTQTELLYKDPLAAAEQAASEIAARTGIAQHDVALVMGSGWVSAVDALGTPVFECNAEEFTGFFAPAVEGHTGKVRSYEIESDGKKLRALVFLGRTHLYEVLIPPHALVKITTLQPAFTAVRTLCTTGSIPLPSYKCVLPRKTSARNFFPSLSISYDRTLPECPSTAGAKKPVNSSALHSKTGVPSASTALTQPDPITSATSC